MKMMYREFPWLVRGLMKLRDLHQYGLAVQSHRVELVLHVLAERFVRIAPILMRSPVNTGQNLSVGHVGGLQGVRPVVKNVVLEVLVFYVGD